MEVNMVALEAALDHILAHPEQWNQDSFVNHKFDDNKNVCGTTFCLAGTVCIMNLPIRIGNGNGIAYGVNTVTEREVVWEQEAENILNIPHYLGFVLFYNTGNAYDWEGDTYWTSAQDFVDWVRKTVQTYRETGVALMPDPIETTALHNG